MNKSPEETEESIAYSGPLDNDPKKMCIHLYDIEA